MATVFATVTTPGPPGPQGPPGYSPMYIVSPGPPLPIIGQNGDMYINTNTGDLYGPKTNGQWGGIVFNIMGPAGPPGATGPAGYSPEYHVAAGPPAPALGNNGDMYINSTTSDVYGPKTAGAWGPIVCNIQGAIGPEGPPGVAYTPKGAWSSGTQYAQGDQVTYNSALYISLQSGNIGNIPSSVPQMWQPVVDSAGQTPWLQQINANGFNLMGVPLIQIGNTGGTGAAANIYGTSSVLFIESAGVTVLLPNIGIGGLAFRPAYPLDVVGDVNCSGVFRVNGVAIGAGNQTPWTSDINAAGFQLLGAGNVGIGIATPAYPLDIRNANLYTLAHLAGFNGADSGMYLVSIGGSSAMVGCGMEYQPSGWIAKATPACSFGDNGSGLFQITTDSGLTVGNTFTPTVRLAINKTTGNVGIGTAAPGVPLDIVSSAASQFRCAVTGGGQFYLRCGASGIATVAQFWMDTPLTRAVSIGAGYAGGVSSPDLVFASYNGTTWAEHMRMTNAGNVGIGTTAPANVLHIAGPNFPTFIIQSTGTGGKLVKFDTGTIGANQILRIGEYSASDILSIDLTNQRVGIDNNAPAYALDVTGTVNCTGGYRVNGVPFSGGGVTTQNVVTGSRALSGVYQNTTGKPMLICVTVNIGGGSAGGTGGAYIQTDSANPPTTMVVSSLIASSQGGSTNGTSTAYVSCWVLPNNYYRAVPNSSGSATPTVNLLLWVEWY